MAAALVNHIPSSSPTSHKRKREDFETQPLTPPLNASDPEATRFLSRAVNVLSTAATALSQVTVLYQSDHHAREGLVRAVETITQASQAGGKLIICGVGKSGLVGRKIVATMKSFGIPCSFMHAAEALHGDLGDIRKVHSNINNVVSMQAANSTIYCRTTPSSLYLTQAKHPNSSLSSPISPNTRPSSP